MELESIHEPLDEYANRLKDEHSENTKAYFEDLVLKSGVDEEENKKTIALIEKYKKEIEQTSATLRKIRRLRTFFIFLILALGAFGYYVFTAWQSKEFLVGEILDLVIIGGAGALIITFLIIIFAKLNKRIKQNEKHNSKLKQSMDEEINIAWSQMRELNVLFDWGMPAELVEKTLKIIKMDPYFDSKRFDLLHNRYNLSDNSDINSSVLFVQSGEIVGNPFVICKSLKHYMGKKVYSGSLEVTWYEYKQNSDGSIEEVRHDQTLSASVEKPFPEYFNYSYLIYGNDAAPNLTFSRTSGNANSLSEKKLEKVVAKGEKQLKKKEEKSIKKGGDFTAMDDSAFEVLFNALNRNNEVEFRLLFTPLAQKQMVKILKDKTIGFGDDFDFYKNNKINLIAPNHLNKVDINTDPNRYMHYDLQKIRETFIKYNNEYFKSIYMAFAPILCIPLYQQNKPFEYIYKQEYNSNVSCWEHESIVNDFDQSKFKNAYSDTLNILKTRIVSKVDDMDLVEVKAHGYHGIDRVDYVSRKAGDGNVYQVPVEWVEYLPVEKSSFVAVKVADNVDRKTYINKTSQDNNLKDFILKRAGSSDNIQFRRRLVSYITKLNISNEDSKILNELFNKESESN